MPWRWRPRAAGRSPGGRNDPGPRAGGQGRPLGRVHSHQSPAPGDRATVGQIAAVRDRTAGLRGSTTDFDIAVWGELDSAGQVAAHLPGYRAVGATWWVESPGSGPGWLAAVRERLREPASGGPKVQSPRGRAL